MEESYLAGLLVSILFLFVLLRKDEKSLPVVDKDTTELSRRKILSTTGVERYLNKQKPGLTGVAKYLQNKEVLGDNSDSVQVMSGVAKYLSAKEQASVSSVSRYLEKQAAIAKERAKRNLSGVDKYLINRG